MFALRTICSWPVMPEPPGWRVAAAVLEWGGPIRQSLPRAQHLSGTVASLIRGDHLPGTSQASGRSEPVAALRWPLIISGRAVRWHAQGKPGRAGACGDHPRSKNEVAPVYAGSKSLPFSLANAWLNAVGHAARLGQVLAGAVLRRAAAKPWRSRRAHGGPPTR